MALNKHVNYIYMGKKSDYGFIDIGHSQMLERESHRRNPKDLTRLNHKMVTNSGSDHGNW